MLLGLFDSSYSRRERIVKLSPAVCDGRKNKGGSYPKGRARLDTGRQQSLVCCMLKGPRMAEGRSRVEGPGKQVVLPRKGGLGSGLGRGKWTCRVERWSAVVLTITWKDAETNLLMPQQSLAFV
jgi:hypothetical protein